jgi:hypothetical protein
MSLDISSGYPSQGIWTANADRGREKKFPLPTMNALRHRRPGTHLRSAFGNANQRRNMPNTTAGDSRGQLPHPRSYESHHSSIQGSEDDSQNGPPLAIYDSWDQLEA